MADVVVTGAVGAKPLTSLASWKEALRALRKGDDTQVDALYPRVLKTIEWYYNQFNDVDREEFVSQRGWKEIMEQLASGKGIQLLGNIISKLVKRLLSKPSTVARGLNVLVQLAGISGHLSMNLLDLYTGMAKQFGFKLVVGNGVEAYRGAPAVALFTFVVAANDDNKITIRLGNQTGGAMTGGAMSLQELLTRAHAPVKAQRRKTAPASHRGASAGQTSYALSGRPPPLPGFHEMSDGTIMKD